MRTAFDSSTPLTFRTDSKISGCSGFDPNAINLETPDRLSSLWANWTVAQCKASGSHTSPTRSAFLDEGSAVKGFASGDADVTLAATGYRTPGFDPTTKRAYVATPLALKRRGAGGGRRLRAAGVGQLAEQPVQPAAEALHRPQAHRLRGRCPRGLGQPPGDPRPR